MDLTAALADRMAVPTAAGQPFVIEGATRADLPAFLAARGYAEGAEIGVYKGEHAEALCQGIPGLHLSLVDAWAPFLGADGRKIYHSAVPAYVECQKRMTPCNVTYVREWSPGAASLFADRSLDFLYLDADHRLPAVMADLAAWHPKVRPGGVMAGHDYDQPCNRHNHVALAMQAWTSAYHIRWYVLGDALQINRTWLYVV
jgi:hypothetical protein